MQVGGLVLRAEVVGEGNALFAYGGKFGAALGNDGIFVLCRCRGFVLDCHENRAVFI
jgi:hypothetical protein